MFCPNCGNEIKEIENACGNCGWKNTISIDVSTPNIKSEDSNIGIDNGINFKQHKLGAITLNKKILIIVSLIFVVFIILIVSITNSESYRINKATKYLLDGNTSAALSKISDIYSTETDLMRSYSSVIEAKNNFEIYCESKSSFGVQSDDESNDYSAVEHFMETLEAFYKQNEDVLYLLPEELKQQAKYYLDVYQSIDVAEDQDGIFSDLLKVYENDFVKNNIIHMTYVYNDSGRYYFTLNGLSKNVDTTNAAYNEWNANQNHLEIIDVNKGNGAYVDFSKSVFSDFISDCNELVNACKNEADSEQEFIDFQLKEWEGSDDIYMNEIDEDYTVTIISSLPAATGDNFYDFSDYFTHCLQFNLLRYYLFYTE